MLQGRLPLVLAAVFAVLAGVVAYLAIEKRSDDISEGWQPIKAIVADRDLAEGETLTRDNVSVGLVPKVLATKSIVTLEDMNRTPVFGRKLAVSMQKGDPLLWSHIHTKTGQQRLAEAVQTKGRAISIRVSPESTVHHWIEPSDRVDIVGVFRDPRSREMVSMTLLQNVIVLATGRIGGRTNRRLLSEQDKAYNTVTLQLLPEGAEMMVLAQELGSLYLTLRNAEDNEITDLGTGKTTMQTLVTGERSKRLSKTQAKIFKVEIIRGNKSEKQTVP